ncbi:MAG: hypothetical protein Q7T44_08155 [Parvibaculum sp.]|nr:hypothetical protein [Parvibaculum sp.]MDO9317983.1 hypothetical protein [Gammaproteobacteria bacterium]
MDILDLREVRKDLAIRSFWNIGFFIAGFIFWTFVLVTGQMYPLEQSKAFWLAGTFLIFPTAVLASKLVGADPFTKGNRLADLVGYTHMSAIALSFPLVIASFIYFPEAMLLVMAIAYCIDFYVMSWAFGTRIFGIHAAVRVLLASFFWFMFPATREIVIPVIVASCYMATVLLIPPVRRNWLHESRLLENA